MFWGTIPRQRKIQPLGTRDTASLHVATLVVHGRQADKQTSVVPGIRNLYAQQSRIRCKENCCIYFGYGKIHDTSVSIKDEY